MTDISKSDKERKNIVMVMGAFHRELIEQMRDEAVITAKEVGLTIKEEIWVPGSLEKPLALQRALSQVDIDGAAVLGIIERGQTDHGFVMGQAVTQAFIQLQLQHNKPIGVGIIGPGALEKHYESRLKPYASKAIRAVAYMLERAV